MDNIAIQVLSDSIKSLKYEMESLKDEMKLNNILKLYELGLITKEDFIKCTEGTYYETLIGKSKVNVKIR